MLKAKHIMTKNCPLSSVFCPPFSAIKSLPGPNHEGKFPRALKKFRVGFEIGFVWVCFFGPAKSFIFIILYNI